MLTTELRCPGCERLFRPHGLAVHISKSRDARCRGGGVPLVSQVPTVFFPHTASQQLSNLFPLSEAPIRGHMDDNLDPQSSNGKFIATCTHRIHY